MNNAREQAAIVRENSRPWDPADHLENLADVVAYLEAALEDGDPEVIAGALEDVTRSSGMDAVAARSGLSREALRKSLSHDDSACFATVFYLLRDLGLRLHPVVDFQGSAEPVEDRGAGWSDGFALPFPGLYLMSANKTFCSVALVPAYQ